MPDVTKSANLERRELPYKVYMKEVVVDYTKADLSMLQNEVDNIIDIPANTYVAMVRAEVLVVEGAARNFDVGDGDNAAGYHSARSANAIAEFCSAPVSLTEGAPNTVTGFSNGKYYAAADTIDVRAPSAGGLAAAKIKFTALMFEFNS